MSQINQKTKTFLKCLIQREIVKIIRREIKVFGCYDGSAAGSSQFRIVHTYKTFHTEGGP